MPEQNKGLKCKDAGDQASEWVAGRKSRNIYS